MSNGQLFTIVVSSGHAVIFYIHKAIEASIDDLAFWAAVRSLTQYLEKSKSCSSTA